MLGPADAVPARRRKQLVKSDEIPNQLEDVNAAASDAGLGLETPVKKPDAMTSVLGSVTPHTLPVATQDSSFLAQSMSSVLSEGTALVSPQPSVTSSTAPLSATDDSERRPPNERHFNSVQSFVAALVAPNLGHRLTLSQATKLRAAWRDANRQQFNVACMVCLLLL